MNAGFFAERCACAVAIVALVGWPFSAAFADSRLADALERGDRAAASSLLDQSADVQAPQPDGTTALHWAVHHNDADAVRRLIAAGANVSAENRYGVPPLLLACRNGSAEVIELLLKAGADPNATAGGGETALMIAARTGRRDAVETLLAYKADVDDDDRQGQTALMWAAAEGHVDVVDALLEAGADEEARLKSGFNALFFAVREGRAAVVERLLRAGLDVNSVMQPASDDGPNRGVTPLLLAIENGHFELAAALLEAGAKADDSRRGYTALHALTWVRKPLRGDGDPPPQGSGRLSSLELVRRLVAHGADVNARHGERKTGGSSLDKADATPFLLAAETGDLPLLKLLLELGADPRLMNVDDCTPLLAACGVGVLGNGDDSAGTEEEALAVVAFLLDLGLDINAVDENGETAMHGAAYLSWTQLVQFLADHGADHHVWNRPNRRKWTPLKIAEGHRPGNFRPSPETIAAIQRVLPPAADSRKND